jgi:hypothetical protein
MEISHHAVILSINSTHIHNLYTPPLMGKKSSAPAHTHLLLRHLARAMPKAGTHRACSRGWFIITERIMDAAIWVCCHGGGLRVQSDGDVCGARCNVHTINTNILQALIVCVIAVLKERQCIAKRAARRGAGDAFCNAVKAFSTVGLSLLALYTYICVNGEL